MFGSYLQWKLQEESWYHVDLLLVVMVSDREEIRIQANSFFKIYMTLNINQIESSLPILGEIFLLVAKFYSFNRYFPQFSKNLKKIRLLFLIVYHLFWTVFLIVRPLYSTTSGNKTLLSKTRIRAFKLVKITKKIF